MSLVPEDDAAAKSAPRSAPELAVLLLELARIVKARRFYGAGDARLVEVFGRSLRAWRADLSRSGALTLEIHAAGFSELGGGGLLHHARLEDLLRDLQARSVESVSFDADMDGDALAAFADLVAAEPPDGAEAASFDERLQRVVPVGISVRLRAEAPAAARSDASEPAPAVAATAELEQADAAELGRDAGVSPEADTLPMDPSEQLSQLDMLLAELEVCETPSDYQDLARRSLVEAERMRENSAVVRVLERFAGDAESKQNRVQDVAASLLERFSTGDALGSLLDRVAHAEGGEQVRAVQILALVGEPIVAPVLDRMAAFPERIRRERLAPLVLALGERCVPELMRRLDLSDRGASRSAALLLGMLQHPAAIPRLAELSLDADLALRDEAGKALVRIGGDDAVAALARGLRDKSAEVAIAAAHHLAATSSAQAVAPLGHALERALGAKDVNLAKELLRALGRLGRPEANSIFGSLMRRKSGLGSRWMRDVKIAAASALATVPGDQAVALLAEALQTRDDALRRAAQRALDRRAESVSRAVPGALR